MIFQLFETFRFFLKGNLPKFLFGFFSSITKYEYLFVYFTNYANSVFSNQISIRVFAPFTLSIIVEECTQLKAVFYKIVFTIGYNAKLNNLFYELNSRQRQIDKKKFD